MAVRTVVTVAVTMSSLGTAAEKETLLAIVGSYAYRLKPINLLFPLNSIHKTTTIHDKNEKKTTKIDQSSYEFVRMTYCENLNYQS